ncbi:DUF6318 family protein [Paeniglutamicibacter sp. NPDC091659]|uniref:DUF6318 family protein n=1 Tax=Paeniglutamicibacter sp. NPDC091659 TaxID=3364389 RepID=UPI00382EC62E
MIGKTKSVIVALCAGAFVMGTAGCTASADPAGPSSSPPAASTSAPSASPIPTAKPTPKPIPASSKGPAQNWPVPKMPEAAKEKSEEGIVAFTKYWFELVDFSVWTNDTKPIKAVTERSCIVCAEQIIDPTDRNHEYGGWHAGGKTTVAVNMAVLRDGVGIVGFSMKRDELEMYLPSGKLTGTVPETEKPLPGTLYLTYDKNWSVSRIEFIDPGGN